MPRTGVKPESICGEFGSSSSESANLLLKKDRPGAAPASSSESSESAAKRDLYLGAEGAAARMVGAGFVAAALTAGADRNVVLAAVGCGAGAGLLRPNDESGDMERSLKPDFSFVGVGISGD